MTVSGSTFTPSQISSIVWRGVLGSLSGSTLTMTPAAQDTAPDIEVGGTTYTASQVDTLSWSGVTGRLSGTTLSLTAVHNSYYAGCGLSLTGSVFDVTRPTPVITYSYSPLLVRQKSWASGTTASISGDHLTITPPGGSSGIPDGPSVQGLCKWQAY